MATQATASMTESSWLADRIRRSQWAIISERVDLTPELAMMLMEINPDNRSINQRRVSIYASDMTAGRWAMNGEAVVVSRDGNLNDGQHRCAAVIASSVTVPTMITFGVNRETRLTTNQGVGKGAGDYLSMQGVRHANIHAAIARLLVAYEHSGGTTTEGMRASNAAVLERGKDPEIASAADFAAEAYRKMSAFLSSGPIGFCFYIANKKNPELAAEYFGDLMNGANLTLGDPALSVRNRLMTLGKIGRGPKIEVVLRGWQAKIEGRQLMIPKIMGTLPIFN